MREAFDRSAAGRRNRALFYNVDRVVYVEGGRDDKGLVESFDGLFWRRVIGVFRPDLRLRILPRGGKDQLIALSHLINEDRDENVIIAMDRDYDGLFNRTIKKRFVVYTSGYSFENDVFYPETLLDLFINICPVCDDTDDIRMNIDDLLKDFCADAWWAQFADVCGGLVSRKVIDRDHVQKYFVNGSYGVRPKISKSAFSIDVYRANSGNPREKLRNIPFKKSDLPSLAVGHLYASFCFKLMMFLHYRHSNTARLTKDSILTSAISNFVNFIASKPQSALGVYYRSALANC